MDDADVQLDEDFAEMAWLLSHVCASARLSRCLYLLAWPHRFASVLKGSEREKTCFDDFQFDCHIFDARGRWATRRTLER